MSILLSVKMTTKRSGGEVEFNRAPNNIIILVKPSVMGPIQLSCFKFFGEKIINTFTVKKWVNENKLHSSNY